MIPNFTHSNLLVSTAQLTFILIITATIFAIFIALAIFKMYKLKAENKRLLENSSYKSDVDQSYQDFTDGHLYENK